MFGLSWTQIGIVVVVGVFLLGPERIPTAVRFVVDGATKARGMLAGAQDGLRREIGPELDELRRQVAELQSLREMVNLREFHPQRLLGDALTTSAAAAVTDDRTPQPASRTGEAASGPGAGDLAERG